MNIKGILRLPSEIPLPGLTLGVMTLVGISYIPEVSSFPDDKIKYEVYKDINICGAEVEELEIPDTVTTLVNISHLKNITHFKFPRNFQRGSSFFNLCYCPKLTTVEFGEYPLSGFSSFFKKSGAIMRFIIPNMSWLLKLRSEAYDFMNVYERHLVDFEGFFHKKTNPFSSIPITLHFKEINDDLENFEVPESWEEAEKICGFLNDFPEFYTQIKRVVIPASVIWSDDDDYIEGPYGESLDSWKFEGGNIRWFFHCQIVSNSRQYGCRKA